MIRLTEACVLTFPLAFPSPRHWQPEGHGSLCFTQLEACQCPAGFSVSESVSDGQLTRTRSWKFPEGPPPGRAVTVTQSPGPLFCPRNGVREIGRVSEKPASNFQPSNLSQTFIRIQPEIPAINPNLNGAKR
eukprot:2082969-Rhodomonas_salina.1